MAEEQLPDAEQDVLSCLLRRKHMSVQEICDAMQPYRPMTRAAASTLLKRLGEKRLVKRVKAPVGKAYLYSAAVPARRTYRLILGDLVQRVFAGRGTDLVSALFETHPPTAEEIDELQEIVDQLRQRRGKRSDHS